MSSPVRPPLYSVASPLTKYLSVGYPSIPNLCATPVSTVQSTLARRYLEFASFNALAALAYSGANCLQCPHHGASSK